MDELIIFNRACRNEWSNLFDVSSTSFSVVKNILKSLKYNEGNFIAELDKTLCTISKINDKNIEGVKLDDIRKIINTVFMLNETSISPAFVGMTPSEVYLYFCYVERIVKSKADMRFVDEEEKNERERKFDKERKLKQEKDNQLKNQLENMSELDRFIFQIKNKQNNPEQIISEAIAKITSYPHKEQVMLATVIKDFYIDTKKWEGKLSKKLKEKVAKIKAILCEE